ncbi:MAG: T9SS type A sorting domain-containing protein [Lentimicrobiaceae bacterium]|nr:T9SS type A sorting domain-containing protein [Lentimicrobiaceae bacterium]
MKKILFLLSLAPIVTGVQAQWKSSPDTNTCFAAEENYTIEMQVLSDGSWFLYTDGPKGGAITPYLRYFDKDGVSIWEEPLQIANEKTETYTVVNDLTFLDRDENIVVIARDLRKDGVNSAFTAYRFDRTGKNHWGENGVFLHGDDSPDFCAAIKIAQLTDGSYVFVWQEVDYESDNSRSILKMQRLSADGERLWGNGKTIEGKNTSITYPYVAEAGNNEFILMYASGITEELYARKLDFDGNDVWAQPTLMFNGSMGSVPLWTRMNVIALDGGLLAAFPAFIGDLEVPYLSWVKGDGSHAFADAEKGFRIGYSDDFRTGYVDVVGNVETKTIYALWREFDPNTQSWQRMAMQKVGFDGELQWEPTGLTIAPLKDRSVAYYSVRLGKDNSVLAAYMENTAEPGYERIQANAVYVNEDGQYIWKDTTVTFANYPDSKSRMISSPLVQDQWIFLWDDFRDFDGSIYHNVYGQNLHLDGSLGVQSGGGDVANEKVITLGNQVRLYPNPADQTVCVELNRLSEKTAKVRVDLLNINGSLACTMYEGYVAGDMNVRWNRSAGITPGLYIVRVTEGDRTFYGKIILK